MEEHQDDQSHCSWFNDLPIEITQKILEKLPIDSLARCMLLNKSFCTIIKDQKFANNHFSNAAKRNPYFLLSYQKSFYLHRTDSNPDDAFKEIHTPFLFPEIYIIGSCNGYVCLTTSSSLIRNFGDRLNPWGGGGQYKDIIFIWNPLTTHFIKLPTSANCCSWVFGFGFHPLTQEYKVVKIYYIRDGLGRPTIEYMQIFTVGKDVWRNLKVPSNFTPRTTLRSNKRGVCVNGSMYWSGRNENNHLVVLALDLAKEEFTEIRAPYEMNWTNCQNMTEIRGYLAMLVFHDGQLEIWTLKDSWTLQGLIGNYAEKIHATMQRKIEGGKLTMRGGYTPYPDHTIYLLEDDMLLMYFGIRGILCYDLKHEVFVDLNVRLPGFEEYPFGYEVVALVGSLININYCGR